MYSTLDGERMAANFLAREPEYNEPAWVDAYATMLGRCRVELDPTQCSLLARQAFAKSGEFNPKIVAYLDVELGERGGQLKTTSVEEGARCASILFGRTDTGQS